MEVFTRIIPEAREWAKGQTMTEYALILAAVAIVVYVTYQILGQDINAMMQSIDTELTST